MKREGGTVESGRANIAVGLAAMVAAAFGGFALGNNLDPYFAAGYAQIPLWRYLTKAGHSHGMPFGLINMVVGLLLPRLSCTVRTKRVAAVLTVVSLFLPIGVCLRGLTQGAEIGRFLAMTGGTSLVVACVVLLVAVIRGDRAASG
jgi:hypothetical protein